MAKVRLLDLGGGSGTYSALLAKSYMDLEAVVFDLPSTVEVAAHIGIPTLLGVPDRVSFWAGDYFRDSFPADNFDIVLLSQILHNHGDEDNIALLLRARNALAPGGMILIWQQLLRDDLSGPGICALLGVQRLLLGEGRTLCDSEVTLD